MKNIVKDERIYIQIINLKSSVKWNVLRVDDSIRKIVIFVSDSLKHFHVLFLLMLLEFAFDCFSFTWNPCTDKPDTNTFSIAKCWVGKRLSGIGIETIGISASGSIHFREIKTPCSEFLSWFNWAETPASSCKDMARLEGSNYQGTIC